MEKKQAKLVKIPVMQQSTLLRPIAIVHAWMGRSYPYYKPVLDIGAQYIYNVFIVYMYMYVPPDSFVGVWNVPMSLSVEAKVLVATTL